MKLKMKKSIIFAIFLILGGSLLYGCSFNGLIVNNLKKADGMEFYVDEDVEAITEININTGLSDIELIESEDYHIKIDMLYWEEKPEYSIQNGVLTYDDTDAFPNSYSINFHLENVIKVYLPKGASIKNISIKSSSGDVNLAGFIADTLDASISYGDFSCKNTAAGEANITLSSGSSHIIDFQAGDLKFTNSYGDAEFTNINIGELLLPEGSTFKSLDITMSSGDVELNNLVFSSIDILNSYGDITCKELSAEELDSELSSGRFKLSESTIKDVKINNSYGDIILELIGQKDDYQLDLGSSYGKVRVEDKTYEEHLIVENDGSGQIKANCSSGDIEVSFTK